MSRFKPLLSNRTEFPVMHLDTEAPLPYLFACADRRFRMARSLLDYVQTAEDSEVRHLVNVALLLLEDGCDTMRIVEQHVASPKRGRVH